MLPVYHDYDTSIDFFFPSFFQCNVVLSLRLQQLKLEKYDNREGPFGNSSQQATQPNTGHDYSIIGPLLLLPSRWWP